LTGDRAFLAGVGLSRIADARSAAVTVVENRPSGDDARDFSLRVPSFAPKMRASLVTLRGCRCMSW
jgi:hypothetical protein